MSKSEIMVGDIIQITNKDNGWYGCIFIVDTILSYGLYASLRMMSGRISIAFGFSDYEIVGKAKELKND